MLGLNYGKPVEVFVLNKKLNAEDYNNKLEYSLQEKKR